MTNIYFDFICFKIYSNVKFENLLKMFIAKS